MALQELLDNIAENLYTYVIIVAVIILAFFIYRLMMARYRLKQMETMAAIELDRKKQEIMEKKLVIEELKNAAIILNDSERRKLEEIRTDSAILSRKLLYNMNEAEERMRRLELGNDNVQVINTLQKIREQERKLFGSVK